MSSWFATHHPIESDLDVLRDGVLDHGRALAAAGRARPLACFLREDADIAAGAAGRIEHGRLFISHVWVEAERRNRGLGAEALRRIEAEASSAGCRDALIETLDDRVAALYRRLGYSSVAVIPAYVGPFTRHVLVKSLGREGAASPSPTTAARVAPLGAGDVSRYRELMLHAYAAAPDAFTSTPEERAAEPESWWLRRIADPTSGSQAFGAFVGDELVGTVALEFQLKPKTRHKAHLIGMFVRDNRRGLGAGELLVHAALNAARARPGVRIVTLTVTEGNAPAIRLYERCGFQAFGVEPMAIATEDGFKAKVHMWMSIEPLCAAP